MAVVTVLPISLPLWRSVAHVPQMAVSPSVRRIPAGICLSRPAAPAGPEHMRSDASWRRDSRWRCRIVPPYTLRRKAGYATRKQTCQNTQPRCRFYIVAVGIPHIPGSGGFRCAVRWGLSGDRANPLGRAGNPGRSVRPGGLTYPRRRPRAGPEPRSGVAKAPVPPAQEIGAGWRLYRKN